MCSVTRMGLCWGDPAPCRWDGKEQGGMLLSAAPGPPADEAGSGSEDPAAPGCPRFPGVDSETLMSGSEGAEHWL